MGPERAERAPASSAREERAGDAAAVRRVVAAAFRSEVEAGLVDALRRDPSWIESGWVAERDGEVVAHVLVVPMTVGGEPASGIGIVSVRPDAQRQGYGTAAMWAAIRHLI